MASRDLNDLETRTHGLAIEFLLQCKAGGVNAFIDATYRSNEEQDADYAQGRTVPGKIITHAKAGESPHNCTDENGIPAARAFDIAIYDDNGELDWDLKSYRWEFAHQIGRDLGLELGVDWPEPKTDGPHFELKNWQTV
jgi:peptidoglycan L-alanyl-D-glutamate endopeptidase CwlK